MSEVSIRFYAMPGCPNILQAPAHCGTILITGPNAEHLKITAVRLNGVPLKFRALGSNSSGSAVSVSPPIPFEGDRVELLCEAAGSTVKAPEGPLATLASPDLEYGLQRRTEPAAGVSR
jgi:hypothetical protein